MILTRRTAFSPRLTWTMVPILALWCVFAWAGYSPSASQSDKVNSASKLVIHVKGNVQHLSLPSNALPAADVDQDGHLSLEELQDFVARRRSKR